MVAARKFIIGKDHVEHARKVDPDLDAILPPLGYVVEVFGDFSARPKSYSERGFDIVALTDVVESSMAPVVAARRKAFLLIGTNFSKDPSAAPYQKFLRSKGVPATRQLALLAATRIHHEAIHIRLQIDVATAATTKPKDISIEYLVTVLALNRMTEGPRLIASLNAAARQAGLDESSAMAFAHDELEKFAQEKFAFARVNRLTPGYLVTNEMIEPPYFRRFEARLAAAGGSAFERMKSTSNSAFAKQLAERFAEARKALSAYYIAWDSLPVP